MSRGRWRVRQYVGKDKCIDEVFHDLRQALQYNAACRLAKQAGQPFPRRKPEPPVAFQSVTALTLDVFLNRYLGHRRHVLDLAGDYVKPAFKSTLTRIRKYLDGSLFVYEISELDVKRFRDNMRDAGIGKGTQDSTLRVLRQSLDWAREHGLRGANAARDVRGIEPDRPCRRRDTGPRIMWTARDVRGVLRAGVWRDRVPLFVAYVQGLRPGELLGLNLEDVDLTAALMYVRAMGGGPLPTAEGKTADRVERTKNQHSRRRLRIPSALVEVLHRYILEVHGIDMAAGPLTPEQRVRPLFLGVRGGRLSNQVLNNRLGSMLKVTGWDYETVGFFAGVRHFRKCARTALQLEGVHGQHASTWMGHKTDLTPDGSARTTLQSYSGPLKTWEEDVHQAWETVLSRDMPDIVAEIFTDERADRYLTMRDAADQIGVSLMVIENWVQRRRVTSYKAEAVGLFEGVARTQLVFHIDEVETLRAEVQAQAGTLSVTEFATQLGVPNSTVYRWVRSGLLPTVLPAASSGGRVSRPQHLIESKHVDRIRRALAAEDELTEMHGVHVLTAGRELGVRPKEIAKWRRSGMLEEVPTPYRRLGSHVTKASVEAMRTKRVPDPPGPGRWLTMPDAAEALGRSRSWMRRNARRAYATRARDGKQWVWVPA